jgi:hypothetical protein
VEMLNIHLNMGHMEMDHGCVTEPELFDPVVFLWEHKYVEYPPMKNTRASGKNKKVQYYGRKQTKPHSLCQL